MKIRPMGTALSHADRRTDRHGEAKSSFFFRNFVKAPKNQKNGRPYLGLTGMLTATE